MSNLCSCKNPTIAKNNDRTLYCLNCGLFFHQRILAVAGNFSQYCQWIMSRNFSLYDFVYVNGPDHYYGHLNKPYVLIGEYLLHPEYHRFMDYGYIHKFRLATCPDPKVSQ